MKKVFAVILFISLCASQAYASFRSDLHQRKSKRGKNEPRETYNIAVDNKTGNGVLVNLVFNDGTRNRFIVNDDATDVRRVPSSQVLEQIVATQEMGGRTFRAAMIVPENRRGDGVAFRLKRDRNTSRLLLTLD